MVSESKRQSQMEEDNWIKVTTYEEAFSRIKDATGVSDIEVSSSSNPLVLHTTEDTFESKAVDTFGNYSK